MSPTPSSPPLAVEALEEALRRLVGERQRLRLAGADWETLERNRLAIVERQHELAWALIARYAPQFAK